MKDRTRFRLGDVADAVNQIHSLLDGRTFEDLLRDRVMRAAFERFVEILSEASRHIPDALKSTEPATPWRRIGDIGNHLRHAYHRTDAQILWNLYQNGELAALKDAATRMIDRLPQID